MTKNRQKEIIETLALPHIIKKLQEGDLKVEDVFTNEEINLDKWGSATLVAEDVLSKKLIMYNPLKSKLYYYDKVWIQVINDLVNEVNTFIRNMALEEEYPPDAIAYGAIDKELAFMAPHFDVIDKHNIQTRYSIYVFPNGTLYYDQNTGDYEFKKEHNPKDKVRAEENPIFSYDFVENYDGLGKVFRLMHAWGPDLLKQLLYMITYVLFSKEDFENLVFYLVGSGQNGKSVFLRLLRELIPSDAISSLDLSKLTGDKDGSQILERVYVNLTSEIKLEDFDSASFKRITGNDLWSVNIKNQKERVEFVPTAKHISTSNSVPRLKTTTHGDLRRLLILNFNKVFPKVDNFFRDNFKPYLGQLFFFCLKLSKKMKQQGKLFVNKKLVLSSAQTIKQESNSAFRFMQEFDITFDPIAVSNKGSPGKDERVIYSKYKTWCHYNGKSPYDKPRFYYEIDTALEEKTKVPNTVYGRYLKIGKIDEYNNIKQEYIDD